MSSQIRDISDPAVARLVAALDTLGVAFEPGLSDGEVDAIERRYGFAFPLDLRAFLQAGQPSSKGWVDWRGDEAMIRKRLNWPAEGICFDVEHNRFWMREWGERPEDIEAAFAIARRHVADAPMLIPIFGHRYLPAEPCVAGNPVLSVYQTDIIPYGDNLAAYFIAEFGGPRSQRWYDTDNALAREATDFLQELASNVGPLRPIRFWDYFLGEMENEEDDPGE